MLSNEYPLMLYGPNAETRVVNTKFEESKAGPNWSRTPTQECRDAQAARSARPFESWQLAPPQEPPAETDDVGRVIDRLFSDDESFRLLVDRVTERMLSDDASLSLLSDRVIERMSGRRPNNRLET